MGTLYFAHPVNVYNTKLEVAILSLLRQRFPQWNIENPNQLHHQEGYRFWQACTAMSREKHQGMNYFFDEVLPSCNGCIAMPFLDFRYGLGVAGEAKWFLERIMPLWSVCPKRAGITSDDLQKFAESPNNGTFIIRPITAQEYNAFLTNDPLFVVPHEETRLRTWIVYNRNMRSYETSHLVSLPAPEGFYQQ